MNLEVLVRTQNQSYNKCLILDMLMFASRTHKPHGLEQETTCNIKSVQTIF